MPSSGFGRSCVPSASPATSSSASFRSIAISWTSHACGERLIVEADGGQHSEEADAERDAYLVAQGFRVLRFWNNDILGNEDGVATRILEALEAPLPQPLSRRGERGFRSIAWLTNTTSSSSAPGPAAMSPRSARPARDEGRHRRAREAWRHLPQLGLHPDQGAAAHVRDLPLSDPRLAPTASRRRRPASTWRRSSSAAARSPGSSTPASRG